MNWLKAKMFSLSLNSVNFNLVESTVLMNKDWFKGKWKKFQKPNRRNRNPVNKKVHKPKVVSYVCGKPGHKGYQCNQRKGSAQAK